MATGGRTASKPLQAFCLWRSCLDYLAAEQHLHKWAKRKRLRSAELAERLRDANLPHENAASIRITEWAYEQVEKAHGQVWISDAEFQHLGVRWRELLVA